jgi:enamine deaminase RidA (YjgF/YER057c/UK114 family)
MTGVDPSAIDPGPPGQVPRKHVVHPFHGHGFPALAGSGLAGLAHAEGVVLDFGSHRIIHCSGKTATDDAADTEAGRHAIIGGRDIGAQTTQVLRNIDRFLGYCGAGLSDVYRVRVYVVAPMDDAAFAAIHQARSRSVLAENQPASTLVVVAGLARLGAMIEMDAEAVVFAGDREAGPTGTAGSDTGEGTGNGAT